MSDEIREKTIERMLWNKISFLVIKLNNYFIIKEKGDCKLFTESCITIISFCCCIMSWITRAAII